MTFPPLSATTTALQRRRLDTSQTRRVHTIYQMNLTLIVLLVLTLVATVLLVQGKNVVEEPKLSEDEIRHTLDGMTLAALVSILEEQGVYLGDNYYSKEELIEYIVQLTRSHQSKDSTESLSQPHKTSSAEPPAPKDTSSGNSTAAKKKGKLSTWELFKEQVRRDITPLLLLVPAPVRTYLGHMLPKLHNTVAHIFRGALVPMLHVVVHALRKTGNVLTSVATRLEGYLRSNASEATSASNEQRKEPAGRKPRSKN
jgi:biopolymer transport protein ExbD